MGEPIFLDVEHLLAVHRQQIELFGGAMEVRDLGLLESALAAPQNLYLYEESADIFDVAACYASHLTGNHAFVDGNKRVALQSAILCLSINGLRPLFTSMDFTYDLVMGLTKGSVSQTSFADYLFISCCTNWITEGDLIPTGKEKDQIALILKDCPLDQLEARMHAITVDQVTSKLRAVLIEKCERYVVNPERVQALPMVIEDAFFELVDRQLRTEFGMI